MATISNTPLWVDGTLKANNIKAGNVTTSATASGTISVAVSVPGMSGTGNLKAFVTVQSRETANATTSTGVTNATVSGETSSGFTVYINRSTTGTANVFWFAVRNA